VNVGISSSDEYNPDGFPIQKTRNAVTKVLVNDTDTLVIGGLEGNISSNSVQKLPFIGDLPFVGQFFTTKIESEDKRNVSIFITPRIIEVKGTPEEIFGQNID
jgi:type IV pilus assembly protein PilQ